MSSRKQRAAEVKAAIIELWSPEMADDELREKLEARGIRLTKRTVQDYRRRYGLRRRRPAAKIDPAELRDRWGRGLSDEEMATEFGCSPAQVKRARLELGLERHRSWTKAEVRLVRSLWKKGLHDQAIADELARQRPGPVAPTAAGVLRVRSLNGMVRARDSVKDYATKTLRAELARRGVDRGLGNVSTAKLVKALEDRGYSVRISKGQIEPMPSEDVGRRLFDMHAGPAQ